ncbi:GerAB/ArcD/ProY family transporter [Paenibacillus sp.]|uniref:GerAB/ArcD/ProY family transporter n=1 Tax=Paenibacillus sp. TaxID=58172 RepID=UPI002811E28A|nr:GerAB/ArcD/ProY family transporter [Paenibacillus sp.]
MNRYLVYFLVLNMLTNIVSQVSILLQEDRYSGTVPSILIGIPLGGLMLFVFVRLFSRFPKQGLPEIMAGALPRWIGAPFLLLQTALWFVGGFVILLYISEVTKRFINPDFAPVEALALFLTVVVLLANMPSTKVLYLMEIILVLAAPFVVFVIVKAVFSDSLMFDSIREVTTHVYEMPSPLAFNGTMFIFSGFMALCVFNRVIAPDVKRWWVYMAMTATGAAMLLITFLLPIGFHGADGVLGWTYPWFATADSLRLKYGFIERLLFFFLLLNVMISVVAIIVYWHSGLQLFKSVLPRRIGASWSQVVLPYGLLAAAAFASIYIDLNFGLRFIREVARLWLWIQMPNTLLVLAILVWAAYVQSRARRKKGERNEAC